MILTGDDAEDRENWSEFLRELQGDARDHRRWRRNHGDALDRPRPVAVPGVARRRTAAAGISTPTSAREEVLAAADRPERARRDRPDARLRQGAGGLSRRGPGRRRAPDLRRRDHQRSAASATASTGRREPGAPESPIGDFMARAAADGYNFDGTDEEPEPYLGYYYRVLTQAGAATRRAGRWTTWSTATWWPGTR